MSENREEENTRNGMTKEERTKKAKSDQQIAMEVSRNSIIANLILSVMKLLAGVFAHSTAMVSDGIHSASDVLSTFVVILGIRIAGKKSDSNHQYGHERLECVAAILLAVFLAATGLGIGYNSAMNLAAYFQGNLEIAIPGVAALGAAVVSIILKEGMYWYTRAAAKMIHSSAMMADAWHHRSDALSSIGSFVGIFGARLGYPMLDPLAGIIICGFILKAAGDIFMDAVRKMTDEACDQATQNNIRKAILEQEGVLGIDVMKTRVFGPRIYVDVEIGVNGDMALRDAHKIAENVHDKIEKAFPEIKHCMIHVNPYVEKTCWVPEK